MSLTAIGGVQKVDHTFFKGTMKHTIVHLNVRTNAIHRFYKQKSKNIQKQARFLVFAKTTWSIKR